MAFRYMTIFTILILLIFEHGMSFHLLMSSIISFSMFYNFHYTGLSNLCLGSFPGIFTLVRIIINEVIFLVSLSMNLLFIEKLLIFVCWFYILLLCWKCLSDLRVFLVDPLESFKYRIRSSTSRDNWTSSFLVISLLFLYFALLLWLRFQALYWVKVVVVENFCLICDFRGNASSFSSFSTKWWL
jgi:hypothetical protein